jgi:hypothetical protein
MPPDFLNSREDAILLWTVAILSYVTYKDARGLGGAFLGVLRALLHSKLVLLYSSAALYCALVVGAAREIGAWHTSSLKATLYWFVGTAIILAGDAVTRSPRDPQFVGRVLKRVVGVTIVIEFVVNLYVLPFGYELALVFLATVFVGMQVVVQHDKSADPQVRKVIEGVLAAIGVFYVGYFAISALGDLEGFLTRENAESFLIGPALAVALFPFLYAVAWLSRWEQKRLKERFRAASDSPA